MISIKRIGMAAAVLGLVFANEGKAWAGLLDVQTLTAGTNGSFAGQLDGVAVSGAVTVPDASFFFTPTGTSYESSTINGTSPQFSYANIYTPSAALADRIGYGKDASDGIVSLVINFGAPVSNLVFNIANLDGARFTFALSNGLTGLSLLRGNGGGGDGLGVSGNSIVDLNPNTAIAVDPATPPPTAGARSGYGSVQLLGTYQSLSFSVITAAGGDGGSFTLGSAPDSGGVVGTPEPSTLAGAALAGLAGLVVARRRREAA